MIPVGVTPSEDVNGPIQRRIIQRMEMQSIPAWTADTNGRGKLSMWIDFLMEAGIPGFEIPGADDPVTLATGGRSPSQVARTMHDSGGKLPHAWTREPIKHATTGPPQCVHPSALDDSENFRRGRRE